MQRPHLNTMQAVALGLPRGLSLGLYLGLYLGLALTPGAAMAATPIIGTVVAKGSFQLDNATVAGNASLTEGALLETSLVNSTVEMGSGARLVVGRGSKGRLFGDHIVLEKGDTQFERAAGYRLEALGLTIQPETGAARGRVSLAGSNRVQVATLSGSFRVLNSRGVLVANLRAGSAMEFDPQPAGGASRVTGCLVNRSGRLVLRDETTNVTVEVAGPGLEKESGNRVELSGSFDPSATPVSDASQFIRITRVTRISKSCSARAGAVAAGVGGAAAGGAAAGAAGAGAAGAGAAAGVSAVTISILGGVAAAATVGGLAATGSLPGQGSSPSVSR
jgi:hypothetical protein